MFVAKSTEHASSPSTGAGSNTTCRLRDESRTHAALTHFRLPCDEPPGRADVTQLRRCREKRVEVGGFLTARAATQDA